MKSKLLPSTTLLTLPLLTVALSYALAPAQAQTGTVTTAPVEPPVGTTTPTTTTKPATTTPAPPKISAKTVQQMVARVLKETSEIRQLPIKHAVKSGVKSRAEVEQMVKNQIKTQISPNEVMASEIMLRQLGMVPANFDLKAAYVRMLGEQVGGYYDPKAQAFYTTEQIRPAELEVVMSHELTHALQDQNFGLGRLEEWPKHDSDAQMGMKSLVEGDATFVMAQYMMHDPRRALGIKDMGQGSSTKEFNSMPRFMQESLTFPYLKGVTFVAQLHAKGGWAQVSKAFTTLPQSSEQILHVEKYFAREAPIAVKLRDLTPQLGAGWMLLDHDVNGETGLSLILGEYLKDQAKVDRAAAGWGGDHFAVYRGPQNADVVVQDCVWDSETDAREWREAYAQRSTTRLSVKPQQRGALQVWNAAPRGVWLEQRGRRVITMEGTVGAFNPAVLLAALWR